MALSKNRKRLYRWLGNFGTSFFGPLTGSNIAASIIDVQIDALYTIVLSFISSAFALGLLISKEYKELGEANGLL